jgi:RNA 3'-terminal phosphate cyclase (ATP)
VEVGTAGSVTLVLQALMPVLLAARRPSRVVVTGGTDVRQAPPWDFFREVLLRHLARLGARTRVLLARRGYYPGGGGEVAIEVEPAALRRASSLCACRVARRRRGACRQAAGEHCGAHAPRSAYRT